MAIPEYRILLVGDPQVGKTAIMKRFCTGQYTKEYLMHEGPLHNLRHNFIVNGSPCTVVLCEALLDEFSRNDIKADAILMVYSVDFLDFSLASIEIEDEMRRVKEIYKAKNWTEPVFMLVGNLCDLADDERKVSTEEGEGFARWHGILYKEVSARENINIDSTFVTLVEAIQKKKRNNQWCSIQ